MSDRLVTNTTKNTNITHKQNNTLFTHVTATITTPCDEQKTVVNNGVSSSLSSSRDFCSMRQWKPLCTVETNPLLCCVIPLDSQPDLQHSSSKGTLKPLRSPTQSQPRGERHRTILTGHVGIRRSTVARHLSVSAASRSRLQADRPAHKLLSRQRHVGSPGSSRPVDDVCLPAFLGERENVLEVPGTPLADRVLQHVQVSALGGERRRVRVERAPALHQVLQTAQMPAPRGPRRGAGLPGAPLRLEPLEDVELPRSCSLEASAHVKRAPLFRQKLQHVDVPPGSRGHGRVAAPPAPVRPGVLEHVQAASPGGREARVLVPGAAVGPCAPQEV